MWMIDIRHWLNEQKNGPAVPELKLKVKKLAEIITYIQRYVTVVWPREKHRDVGGGQKENPVKAFYRFNLR